MKTQINKSELFLTAWEIYSDNNGNLSFSECLATSWNIHRGIVTNGISSDSSVSDIKECIFHNAESGDAMFVLIEVKNNSKGFQKDIAERVLDGKDISEKQAWCVAYEFKNVA